MKNNMEPNYLKEYEEFMKTFNLVETTGAEVGEMINKMAYNYAKYNLSLASAMNEYRLISRSIADQTDPNTGKPITSSKAEVMAEATPQAAAYAEGRIHVDNLNQIVQALKSLQKGQINEFANG